jgi:hypothetical protein
MNYSEYTWYKSIRKAMNKMFNKNIDEEEIESHEIYTYAQKLINNPLTEALEYLSQGSEIMSGDDDE